MRNLIITADDCGLSKGINAATANLYEEGMVTAASVMTNFEASRHALDLLAHYPGLDVGVHLNLTDGFSLSNGAGLPGLTDANGRFRGRKALFSSALIARRAFLKSAKVELAAQLDFFLQSGIQPRHLTTHLHFHTVPALREIICELAREYGLEWIRNARLLRALVPYNVLLSKSPASASTKPTCNIASPDYVVALQFWMRRGSPRHLLHMLLQVEGTSELVLHPSLEHDSTFPRSVSYPPENRFQETQYFEQFIRLLHVEAPGVFRLTNMRGIG